MPERTRRLKKKVVRSTSQTRYSSPLHKKKTSRAEKSSEKTSELRRRSVKSYIKKPAKKSAKKPVKKESSETKAVEPRVKVTKVNKVKKQPQEFYIGEITHYFPKIAVVVVKVEEQPILIADVIHIKGSADFTQKVQSLQVESKDVRFARKGELVGLQVIEPAKPGDKVFKIKK